MKNVIGCDIENTQKSYMFLFYSFIEDNSIQQSSSCMGDTILIIVKQKWLLSVSVLQALILLLTTLYFKAVIQPILLTCYNISQTSLNIFSHFEIMASHHLSLLYSQNKKAEWVLLKQQKSQHQLLFLRVRLMWGIIQ